MSRKRLTPSIGSNEGGREVKKQKTTPHLRKWAAEVQDFLDLLSPATRESLAKFNNVESRKERDGVIPIHIPVVETELRRLKVEKDTESLEVRLKKIDAYLKKHQDAYDSYLGTHSAVAEVDLTLTTVIWCIQEARDRLPGMFSHLHELLRKLNVTIHRS